MKRNQPSASICGLGWIFYKKSLQLVLMSNILQYNWNEMKSNEGEFHSNSISFLDQICLYCECLHLCVVIQSPDTYIHGNPCLMMYHIWGIGLNNHLNNSGASPLTDLLFSYGMDLPNYIDYIGGTHSCFTFYIPGQKSSGHTNFQDFHGYTNWWVQMIYSHSVN
jgi:hypothetical protein